MRQEPTLCALSRLDRSRPGMHATSTDVAAWYQAKATTHERLAAEATEAGDELGAARETSYAREAAEHAARLRVGEAIA